VCRCVCVYTHKHYMAYFLNMYIPRESDDVCMCVCVYVCERETEREREMCIPRRSHDDQGGVVVLMI
jgi:hypothetical protein